MIAFLSLLGLCQGFASADTAAAFDAANRIYEQGKFDQAAAAYEKLIQAGEVSPSLYFNLGNAYFKAGHIGRAIATYRHTEQLSPRDPDLRANLQFARNQVQSPTLHPGRLERWLGTLNVNEWTGLSAAAVWLTFGLLALRQLRPGLARVLRGWTLTAAASSILLLACLGSAWAGQSLRKTVIIVADEVTVRSGPFEDSPPAFTARDGAELRVLDTKNDWLQITDGTRRSGWVRRDSVLAAPNW